MLTEEQWQNIENFADEDPMRLRLAHHGNVAMAAVIDQIECRQKTRKKLSETLASAPRFYFPTVLSSEQATSDALAEFHAGLIAPESSVFDMTCGLGIDAFHIARKASELLAADINPKIAATANSNAALLGIDNFSAIAADSTELLTGMKNNAFDYIFIDPARRGDNGKRQFALSDCVPDVTAFIDRMLNVAPNVIIKASPMLDISNILIQLPYVSQIISVGTRRECKEIVVICQRGFNGVPRISAVTVGISSFTYTESEEHTSRPVYGMPKPGNILLECYPAAVKAGAFRLLSSRFGITKIAPNTHLYYSECIPEDFPGRGLTVKEVIPFDKRARKYISERYEAMEITARNFPMQPIELAKKLKLKSGGKNRMFAVRDQDNKCWLIITEPIY